MLFTMGCHPWGAAVLYSRGIHNRLMNINLAPHDGRGLQGMLAVLPPHFPRGNPVQLAVDQLHQLVRGGRVAQPPPAEKRGDRRRIAIFLHIH